MPSTQQNFSMWAGDTKKVNILVRDSAGAAVALAGATIRWWMGMTQRSTGLNVLIQKSLGSGIALTATPGEFQVTLLPANTVSVKPGSYYHEAEVVDAAGAVSTVTIGSVTINPAMVL